MSRPYKTTTAGGSRTSNTYSPPRRESDMEEFMRVVNERNGATTGTHLARLAEIFRDIPNHIYGSMKKEVKDHLAKIAKEGINILLVMSKEIDTEIQGLKDQAEMGTVMEGFRTEMMGEIKIITGIIKEQQQELRKYREEEKRAKEEEESVTTKFLRKIDYKLDNIQSREEAIFDRFSDRTLKDSEMATAIVTRKLDTIEENIIAETIELERKLVDRLGREKCMEGECMKKETDIDLRRQIKETGKEITLEITKTIDTVMTECMQDIQNTITYGGTAPENNTETIINKMGSMEENIKEEIIDTRRNIVMDIKQSTERVVKEIGKSIEQETEIQTGMKTESSYAEVTRGKTQRKLKTLHSILITSRNKMDTAEEVIGKAKKILEPEKNQIQIERIRKVKDQRIILSCTDERETQRIKERIDGSDELEAERVRNKNPLIIIKEVKYKMTDNEIKTAIRNQNPEIYIDEMEEDEFKIKFRRRTRNTERCHIIAQIHPEFWKRITKKGHLYIEMERVRVEDQTPLIQCTRCLQFGHGKKFCQESADRCSHCGGLHLRAECPDKKAGIPPQCCNCTHADIQETSHNAFATTCKIREKWDSLARSTTTYD